MTARTVDYLKNTEFTVTGSPGRVVVQDMDDVCDSFAPWDVVGGLATPYILGGSLDGARYFLANGGAFGSMGATPSQRATNGTVLQAAINAAISAGKIFEFEPNLVEINNSAGILVPAQQNGFTWRGQIGGNSQNGYGGTQIVQFYATSPGAPVLTIGDTTGSTTFGRLDFDGVHVRYGTPQTGFTGANTLVIGACTAGSINNIGVQQGGSYSSGAPQGNNGYNGVVFTGGFFFSMTCGGRWEIFGAQNTLFQATNWITGNVVDNLYMNQGGGAAYVPLTGNYIYMNPSGGGVFHEVNCEWGQCNRVMDVEQTSGLRFGVLHIEGISFAGFVPHVCFHAGADIDIGCLQLVSSQILAANLTGGTTNIVMFHDFPATPSQIRIGMLQLAANTAGLMDSPIWISAVRGEWNGGTYGIGHGTFKIENLLISDGSGTNQFAHTVYDENMQYSSTAFQPPQLAGAYEWGVSGSSVKNAMIPISATYTHYGQYIDATLLVPTSVTGFTITLSNIMGPGGTQKPAINNRVHFTRKGGTFSGTVTIVNGGAGGGTLATSTSGTTTPTDYDFIFDGTNWAAFTPVATTGFNP